MGVHRFGHPIKFWKITDSQISAPKWLVWVNCCLNDKFLCIEVINISDLAVKRILCLIYMLRLLYFNVGTSKQPCSDLNFQNIGMHDWSLRLQFYYGPSCCNCSDHITLLSFISLIVICWCISTVQSVHILLCFDLCCDLDLWWPWPKVTTYSRSVILQ